MKWYEWKCNDLDKLMKMIDERIGTNNSLLEIDFTIQINGLDLIVFIQISIFNFIAHCLKAQIYYKFLFLL